MRWSYKSCVLGAIILSLSQSYTVFQNPFLKMAGLFLAAFIMVFSFSPRAFAAEGEYMDSGPIPEQGQEEIPEEVPEIGEGEGEFPEEVPEKSSDDPEAPELEEEEARGDSLESETGTLLEEIIKIRQLLEFLLYALIPLTGAVILVYKFCMWFYYTFIRTVL